MGLSSIMVFTEPQCRSRSSHRQFCEVFAGIWRVLVEWALPTLLGCSTWGSCLISRTNPWERCYQVGNEQKRPPAQPEGFLPLDLLGVQWLSQT